MKFIKVQTDCETQQIQKAEPDKQTWRRPLCMNYNDDLIEMFKDILFCYTGNAWETYSYFVWHKWSCHFAKY